MRRAPASARSRTPANGRCTALRRRTSSLSASARRTPRARRRRGNPYEGADVCAVVNP
jgi:hypothetical protein